MQYRSSHMPYYITIIGMLMLSLGFNCIQYQENKDLTQDKKIQTIFIRYLYLKELFLEKQNFDLKYRLECMNNTVSK